MFLTSPNSASALCYCNLKKMVFPMIYSDFTDKIQNMHIREYTPLMLKALLYEFGFQEECFTTFDSYTGGKNNTKFLYEYPFKNCPHINRKLQGDTLFSVSVSKGLDKMNERPDVLYNRPQFIQDLNKYRPKIKGNVIEKIRGIFKCH